MYPLQVTKIELKHFRCFSKFVLDITQPIVLFEGVNGMGKTSLLEALHYACYLRSFRTHLPRTMIQFGHDSFFIKLNVENIVHDQPFQHEIQVGFSHGKRLVKVDKKSISSYKQLMQHFRVVSLTEDDLALIKEGPQVRRTFLDQAILLTNPDYAIQIKEYRQVVDNRNALLARGPFNKRTYDVLTEQLWHKSYAIQQIRREALSWFADQTADSITTYFNNSFSFALKYRPKKGDYQSLASFMDAHPALLNDEQRFGRTLFGAHLDDFLIQFQDKNSRSYASRGQQKLSVILLKIALIKQISHIQGGAVFLLDDFMTDFDSQRANLILDTLESLKTQLIFTSPITGGKLAGRLNGSDAQIANLTH